MIQEMELILSLVSSLIRHQMCPYMCAQALGTLLILITDTDITKEEKEGVKTKVANSAESLVIRP